MIEMKWCPGCKTEKTEEEFQNHKSRYDGLSPYCKICHNKKGEEYRKKYPDKVSDYHKKRRINLKIKLFGILDSTKCVYCEFSLWPALQFGHKNGDGSQDKERFRDIDQFLNYYINHPEEAREKLEITCANCNWIKRFKDMEYVHISRRHSKNTLG